MPTSSWLGFDGTYNRVAAFARAWTAHRYWVEQTTGRGTFVPLTGSVRLREADIRSGHSGRDRCGARRIVSGAVAMPQLVTWLENAL